MKTPQFLAVLSFLSLSSAFVAISEAQAKTQIRLDSNSEIQSSDLENSNSSNTNLQKRPTKPSRYARRSQTTTPQISADSANTNSAPQSRAIFRDEDTGMEFDRVNNIRFFPLNLFTSAFHAGYERLITAHIAVGGEISIMGSESNNTFLGDRVGDLKTRENYAGAFGQFYFSRGFEGFFFEAGLNYLKAEITSTYSYYPPPPYFGGLASGTDKRSASFWMPHASINYRMQLPILPGLNMTAGLGIMNYIGESLTYKSSYAPNYIVTERDTEYTAGTHFRARVDVGYSF